MTVAGKTLQGRRVPKITFLSEQEEEEEDGRRFLFSNRRLAELDPDT